MVVQAAVSAEQQGLPVSWRRTAVSALVQVCILCCISLPVAFESDAFLRQALTMLLLPHPSVCLEFRITYLLLNAAIVLAIADNVS